MAPSNRPFAHLHCHSHYSLLDGASRIPELVQSVKSRGMNAVALTDHGNLYGALDELLWTLLTMVGGYAGLQGKGGVLGPGFAACY